MIEPLVPEVSAADLTVDCSGAGDERSADTLARRLYAEYGCFLARGLLDEATLEPARQAIRRLIELRLAVLGLPQQGSDGQAPCFDDGFRLLIDLDKRNREVLMGAFRRAMPLQQLRLDLRLVRLSRLLMATDTVMDSDSSTLRVQLPGETETLFHWHQDYPLVQDSEDGVIYWIPLRSLEGRNSSLQIAPGSHRLGVLPTRGYGPRRLHMADPPVADRFSSLTMTAEPGDVLVFSTLLLHASVFNYSQRTRWTFQVRHGNFEYPRAVVRGWPATSPPAARMASFEDTHPEYYLETVDREAPV